MENTKVYIINGVDDEGTWNIEIYSTHKFVLGIYGAKSLNYADDENSPVYIDDLINWIIRTEHDDFSEVFEDDDEN